MFFMNTADILYESYKKALRLEIVADGQEMPETWRSINSQTPAREWKERFTDEIIRSYPEYKEYGLELQTKIFDMQKEISKLKQENLALLESKEK